MKSVISFILMLLILGGCQESTSPTDVKLHLFSDRSDPKYEWVFAFSDQEVVAQRHAFPGYTDPMIFSHKITSAAIPDKFVSGHGNIEPPFEPSGPWYSRIDIPSAASAETRTVYFANDTHALGEAFSDLKADIQSNGKRLKAIPEWVKKSAKIRPYFGYE